MKKIAGHDDGGQKLAKLSRSENLNRCVPPPACGGNAERMCALGTESPATTLTMRAIRRLTF